MDSNRSTDTAVREAIVHKLGIQSKLYGFIIGNTATTIAPIKELAQELEELGFEGFEQLDELTREQLRIQYLMHAEQQVLNNLMHKTSDFACQVEKMDLIGMFNEEIQESEAKLEREMQEKTWKDELYIDFLKSAWNGSHSNEHFNPKKAYKILSKQQTNTLDLPDDDEEDDELMMVGVQMSFICPITQRTMDEVWTSKICKHNFSSAIRNLCQRNGGRIECPVTGCSNYVHMSNLIKDKGLNRQLNKKMRQSGNEEDYVDI